MMDPNLAARGLNSPWEPQILYAAGAYGVPVALIKAVIAQESAWDPNAVNPGDPSYGLMQINTRAHPDVSPQNALDPAFNITYGTNYLAGQIARYGLEGGISAYNAGVPTPKNQPYVDSVLTYKGWYEANDAASFIADGGSVPSFDSSSLWGLLSPDVMTPVDVPVTTSSVDWQPSGTGVVGVVLLLVVGAALFAFSR